MIDLLLTNKDGFMFPSEATTSENTMIAQMYILLFLTKKGSFLADLDIGNSVDFRTINTGSIRLYLQRLHSEMISDRITSINLVSLTVDKDNIYFKVLLNGEETVELSL